MACLVDICQSCCPWLANRRVGMMAAPTETPPTEDTGDLFATLQALEPEHAPAASEPPQPPPQQSAGFLHRLREPSARRGLGFILICLLAGGVIALLELGDKAAVRGNTGYNTADRAGVVFSSARSGNCLAWPQNSPDRPAFVSCGDDHLFEVAASVPMNNFQEPCEQTVRRYLGNRYDPDSRFTIGVLWPGNAATSPAERHLLCGMQLLGPNAAPIPFKGAIAELDQSKVWPPGTCLGIDPTSSRSTEIPVDCTGVHSTEITGDVSLAEKFPAGRPAEAEQDAFIRDACTHMTDAYLAPVALNTTPLALHYNTISAASWSAGSRQVACRIGQLRDDGTWGMLTGSVKPPTVTAPAPVVQLNLPAPPPAAPPPPAETPSPAATAASMTSSASPTSSTSAAATSSSSASPSPSTTSGSASASSSAPPPPPPPPPSPTEEGPPSWVVEVPGMGIITLPVAPPPGAVQATTTAAAPAPAG
jgi:hypothetical protein